MIVSIATNVPACISDPHFLLLFHSASTVFQLKDKMTQLPDTIWCRSLLRSSGEFGSDEDTCFNFSGAGVGSDVFAAAE